MTNAKLAADGPPTLCQEHHIHTYNQQPPYIWDLKLAAPSERQVDETIGSPPRRHDAGVTEATLFEQRHPHRTGAI